MVYRLKIGDEVICLDVALDTSGQFTLTMDGAPKTVEYRLVGDHQIHLSIDGQAMQAYIADMDDGKWIIVNGAAYFIQDADELERKAPKKGVLAKAPQEVKPPMPAVVVALLTQEGDKVVEGQALLVVSAMKMETTLKAPYAGRITRINCKAGDKVAPSMILVEIEKEGV